MNESIYTEKLKEKRDAREKKRKEKKKEKRIKTILKINMGLAVVVLILVVVKWFSGESDIRVEKVEGEPQKVDMMPIVMKAKDPGVQKEEREEAFDRGFPKPPDYEPESITAIINKDFTLPSTYVPKDLTIPNVTLANGHDSDRNKIRKPAAEALEELFKEAEKEDVFLVAVSGYRSFKRQSEIYYRNVKAQGYEEASALSAVPGSSEHQSGLAMDVSCSRNRYDLTEGFCELKEGKWVGENAHRFGFIIRYPKDKTEVTGYAYEPWHLRFVGKKLAAFLYENNLTMEEYYGLASVKE